MLVLTLRIGDEVTIGPDIQLRVTAFKGKQVRIAFNAPDHHIGRIPAKHRKEIPELEILEDGAE